MMIMMMISLLENKTKQNKINHTCVYIVMFSMVQKLIHPSYVNKRQHCSPRKFPVITKLSWIMTARANFDLFNTFKCVSMYNYFRLDEHAVTFLEKDMFGKDVLGQIMNCICSMPHCHINTILHWYLPESNVFIESIILS